jgi:hypothetical protein
MLGQENLQAEDLGLDQLLGVRLPVSIKLKNSTSVRPSSYHCQSSDDVSNIIRAVLI